MKRIADAVKHDWQFHKSHTHGGQTVADVYVCSLCEHWTSYLGAPQFDENDVCLKRDRRKAMADRRKP